MKAATAPRIAPRTRAEPLGLDPSHRSGPSAPYCWDRSLPQPVESSPGSPRQHPLRLIPSPSKQAPDFRAAPHLPLAGQSPDPRDGGQPELRAGSLEPDS
jgi:hypothetical protein